MLFAVRLNETFGLARPKPVPVARCLTASETRLLQTKRSEYRYNHDGHQDQHQSLEKPHRYTGRKSLDEKHAVKQGRQRQNNIPSGLAGGCMGLDKVDNGADIPEIGDTDNHRGSQDTPQMRGCFLKPRTNRPDGKCEPRRDQDRYAHDRNHV